MSESEDSDEERGIVVLRSSLPVHEETVLREECYLPSVVAIVAGSRFLRYREYLFSARTSCRAADFFMVWRGERIQELAENEYRRWHRMMMSHPARCLARIPQLRGCTEVWFEIVLRFLEPWFSVRPRGNRRGMDIVIDNRGEMPLRMWYSDFPSLHAVRRLGFMALVPRWGRY
jgi:hypothetical protein